MDSLDRGYHSYPTWKINSKVYTILQENEKSSQATHLSVRNENAGVLRFAGNLI